MSEKCDNAGWFGLVEPPFSFEVNEHPSCDEYDDSPNGMVTVVPIKFGQIMEVHAIDT